eukprot:1186800-Prorocentrum_minimum.AAC.1
MQRRVERNRQLQQVGLKWLHVKRRVFERSRTAFPLQRGQHPAGSTARTAHPAAGTPFLPPFGRYLGGFKPPEFVAPRLNRIPIELLEIEHNSN